MPPLKWTTCRIIAIVLALSSGVLGFNGFGVPPTFAVGNRARAVAIGDFNGDGLMDLAVVSQTSSIGVQLGCTPGTAKCVNGYLPVVNYAAPNTKAPTDIVAADFNGDGKLDLIVADSATNHITLLQGAGNGSFAPVNCGAQVSCPTGVDPVSMAVGNFAGGVNEVDVAVVNNVSNSVSVFLGNGSSFNAAVNYKVGNAPTAVAIADLNGDGFQDLIVCNGGDGTVTVLLGNGKGGFAVQSTTSVGMFPVSVAAADFNGDGHIDVAVANSGSSNLSILLGKGDGTFSSLPAINAGSLPQSVATGDLNGDGRADLIVSDGAGDNVATLLGNGDGTFQPPKFFVCGAKPDFLAVADLNGDHKLDVVTISRTDSPGGVTVLYGNGDGTLASGVNYAAGSGPKSIALAHFSCTTNWDFAVANSLGNTVSIARGNSDGTFQTPFTLTGDLGPVALVVADFDHTGSPDLAVANSTSNDVSIFLTNSSCTGFSTPVNYPLGSGAKPVSIAAGDFNGDGYPDLAVADQGSKSISVLLNKGDGTFTVSGTFPLGFAPSFVAVGDFNNDNKMDLAVSSQLSNSVAVLLGNGDGTFTLKSQNCAGPTLCKGVSTSVAVADFNGDGKMDLAVSSYDDSSVSVLLGNGDGTFAAAVSYKTAASPLFVAAAPIQGDSTQQDLLVANNEVNNISLVLNNRNKTGTFKSGTSLNYSSGAGPASIAIEDLTGNGKLDLVIANQSGNNVTVLKQQ
jgi:FG-GAP-like repeat